MCVYINFLLCLYTLFPQMQTVLFADDLPGAASLPQKEDRQ